MCLSRSLLLLWLLVVVGLFSLISCSNISAVTQAQIGYNPMIPFLGCEEIRQRVRIKRFLGAGNVQVAYKAKLDGNITVVVKKLRSANDTVGIPKTSLTKGHVDWAFRNAMRFSKLQLEHPGLMRIFGVCDDPDNVENSMIVMEMLPHHMTPPREHYTIDPSHLRAPLALRVANMARVADLIAFISQKNESRPGSPYLLCDPKIENFRFSNEGHLKYADFDFVVPLTISPGYPFRYATRQPLLGPYADHFNGVFNESRLYLGNACAAKDQPCHYFCYPDGVDSFLGRTTEHRCKRDELSHRCPGLGARSSTFWFCDLLLKPFLGHEIHHFPELKNLLQNCTDVHEWKRPHPVEMAQRMWALKARIDGSGSG